MNFTLKQLRYVEAAGRSGSISGAAELLSISQSSITAAIDALDRPWDSSLIRTPAKGIGPTPSEWTRLSISATISTDPSPRSRSSIDRRASVGALRLACYVTTAPHVLELILKGSYVTIRACASN